MSDEGGSPAGFAVDEVGQIAIPVADLEEAVAFYRDVLGMSFLFSAPPGLAFFACGSVRLMLEASGEPRGERRASVIYYRVPEMSEAVQTLKLRGASFDGEPHMIARLSDHELWMAFLRDPADNLLAIMSEVPLRPE